MMTKWICLICKGKLLISDDFKTKRLVNDICYDLQIPFSIAGAVQYQGQCTTIVPNQNSACYRCLFYDLPLDQNKNCAELGVFSPLVGIVGSLQAAETLKYLSGCQNILKNQLLKIDAKRMEFLKFQYSKNPSCEVCGEK